MSNSRKGAAVKAEPTVASEQPVAPLLKQATAARAYTPREGTKQATFIALLIRPEGATLDMMATATSWLPHTTRAALAGLKKQGYGVTSDKADGVRTYRAVPPAAA